MKVKLKSAIYGGLVNAIGDMSAGVARELQILGVVDIIDPFDEASQTKSSPSGRMQVTTEMISDTVDLPQLSFIESIAEGTIRVGDVFGNVTVVTFPTKSGLYVTYIPVKRLYLTGTGAGSIAAANLLMLY
jgi:hypothetical protein